MTVKESPGAVSPQARGRELARLGRQLWQELGSVKDVAIELTRRHVDVPTLQAFRYGCGLSQDQAAARYNEMTNHQTTLGGTTINAWETWARGRGNGSPPPLGSLLILAAAYGRGPLGAADEYLSPTELVAEAYERLAPEDLLSLRKFASDPRMSQLAGHGPESSVGLPRLAALRHHSHDGGEVAGADFTMEVPTVEYGNPAIQVFTLPNPQPGQLLNLEWQAFGYGIKRLIQQIKNLGRRLDPDACFGINEAGLVMATFLASAQFGRCPIGYLKCNKSRDEITLDPASFYPGVREAPTIVLCDFEVKHADVVGFITAQLRQRYPGAEIYFAVFGAMTKGRDLEVGSFDDLTGAGIMKAAGFASVFIAATMSPPGIEPPLELR